jgi:hypothetical protein
LEGDAPAAVARRLGGRGHPASIDGGTTWTFQVLYEETWNANPPGQFVVEFHDDEVSTTYLVPISP